MSRIPSPARVGPLCVMVSSTALDLPQHREQVMKACLQQDMFPVMMESLPTSAAEALDVSMRMVDDADIYLGIFGHRYGYVPAGETLSLTEMEYNRAIQRGIPALIFLMHDDHAVKKSDVETGEGAAKLEAFKRRLGTAHVANFFKSPDDLRAHVINSLARLRQEQARRSSPGVVGDASPLPPLLQEYLRRTVESFEQVRQQHRQDTQRNLLDLYVEAKGATEPPRGPADSLRREPLWDLLVPALQARKPCIVLAEFGMGKSWLLDMILYRLACLGLENGAIEPSWLPFRLSLRGFMNQSGSSRGGFFAGLASGKPQSAFEQLRTQALQSALGETAVREHESALLQLFEEGRFLFLLDALDEAALGSRGEVDAVLTEIGRVGTFTRRSPVILTCRRSFFRDSAQEHSLRDRGFEVFYLQPWSGDELLDYFTRAHALGLVETEPALAIERIKVIHDLRDIASRALLSAMLVDQWAAIERMEHVDMPALYEGHIERALLDWQGRKAQRIDVHELRTFMEELAFLMFRLNSLTVTPADLDEYFSGKFQAWGVPRFSDVAESVVRDVKTNSLLQRDEDNYVFCHASLWEFLVARKIARAAEQGDAAVLSLVHQSVQYRSILQSFLIPMLKNRDKLNLLGTLLRPPT